MSDESIAARIESLVDEEHKLRGSEEQDAADPSQLGEDQRRLEEVQIELDRCWDPAPPAPRVTRRWRGSRPGKRPRRGHRRALLASS